MRSLLLLLLFFFVDGLLLREINLDKVRGWKPFYKHRQNKGLASHFLLDKRSDKQTPNFGELNGLNMVQVGYEVYADGPTRVLRFCENPKGYKRDSVFQSREKIQLRISQFKIQLLERRMQVSLLGIVLHFLYSNSLTIISCMSPFIFDFPISLWFLCFLAKGYS